MVTKKKAKCKERERRKPVESSQGLWSVASARNPERPGGVCEPQGLAPCVQGKAGARVRGSPGRRGQGDGRICDRRPEAAVSGNQGGTAQTCPRKPMVPTLPGAQQQSRTGKETEIQGCHCHWTHLTHMSLKQKA